MKLKSLILLSFITSLALAQKAPTPEEVNGPGPDNSPGGVFGGRMLGGGRPSNDSRATPEGMLGTAKPDDPLIVGGKSGGGFAKAFADNTGGSGPFNAWWTSEPSFANHTIYAPKKVDPAVKLPLLVWANGGCRSDGSRFANFLAEIASHGFMVIANGPNTQPFGTTEGRDQKSMMAAKHPSTQAYQLTESVNWAFAGAAGGKYGTPDTSRIAVAGQSCGGVQAYSAAYKDARIKHIGIFNSGVFAGGQRNLLAQIKQPVGLFHGGPLDMASRSAESDYKELPATLPVIKGSIDQGHAGSFWEKQGGTFGKTAVAWLKWSLNGDAQSKALLFDANSPLRKEGWEFVSRGFN